MQNITLQTSDSDLTANEVLGRLAFAASNDSSGSDAILVAASIYAQAESEFTVSSNSTSLIFSTASSEAATNKLRITSEGHFIPFASGQYDLGSSAYPFRALHVDTSVYSPSGSFDYLVFNTGIADADLSTGQVAWGNEVGTLEIGLTDDLKIQVGQTVLFRVKNSTGSSLSKGQAVYASGVLGGGQIIQAAKFAADESVDEVRFIGLMTDDLANGNDGFVSHFGHIKNVDLRTSNTAVNPNGETWAVGDILFVDDGTPGGLTKVPPKDDIYVALVLADGQNGELFVRITDPGHIDDLHDVNMSGLVDNNLMVWNSGANYWEPTTSMTFNGTTLHTDTDGITAIFGRNNAQTQGGKVRIYVDDNDTAGSVQAIKAFNAKTTGTNYGINATAHGLGATKNVGLYGWAAQATTNWGLWVNAGYGIFDDKVGIKTQSPAFDLHVNGSGYFTNDVYYGGDLVIAGDLFVNGSGIIGDIGIVDNTISSLSGNLLLFPECSGYVGVNTNDPNAMLHVYSATSGDNVFNVEGTNGSLFSVVDNLSGTLMSVNTIAGLPVLEVNSDYSVTAGRFNQNDFVITAGGDIGMGIAAPSGKLHIYDNNSAGWTDTSFRIQNPASANNTYFDIAIGTSTGYGDHVWFKRNGVSVASIYSNNTFYHYTDCLIKTDKQFVAESNGNAFIELLDGSNDMKIGYLSDLRFYSSYSEKMVLDVNGNLGIGTTSPSAKLDVSGVITASGGNSNEWNTSYDWVAASGGLPYVTGVGTANQVAFFNDTDSITSESNLYWDSTNNRLGVGTSTPSNALEVAGGNVLLFPSDNSRQLSVYSTSYGIKAQSGLEIFTGDIIRFRKGSTEYMRIQNDGKVGIGTASPSATLDVNGSVNVANDVIVGGNVTINGTTVTANADSMQVKDPIITLGLASGNVITNDTYDRGLALVTNNGTAFMGWDNSADKFVMLSSGVATNSSGNYDAGTYGDLVLNKVYGSGLNTHIQLNAGSNSIMLNSDSYAGSHTYINTQYTSLNGASTYVNGVLSFPKTGTATSTATQKDSRSITLFNSMWNGSAELQTNVEIASFASTTVNERSRLAFLTTNEDGTNNKVERLSVLTNGNVGIGTTSPSAMIHTVAQSGIIAAKFAGPDTRLDIDQLDTTTMRIKPVGNLMISAGNSAAIRFAINSTEYARLKENGYFGIGTASPSYPLDVRSSTGQQINIGNTTAAGASAIRLGDTAVRFQIGKEVTTNDLVIESLNGGVDESMRINYANGSVTFNETGADMDFRVEGSGAPNALFVNGANGYIGVGTASPTARLEVSGVAGSLTNPTVQIGSLFGGIKMYSDSAYNQINLGGQYSTTLSIGNQDAGQAIINSYGSYAVLHIRSANWINFQTGGQNNRMRILADGKVGVGTTAPTTLLDVSGVITANGGNSDQWNQAYDFIQASGLDGVGAASGVAFWTDSNTLSNDSALIWDNTNNRLGIGTATPLYPLQVSKDGGASTVTLLRLENANLTASQSLDLKMATNKDITWDGGSGGGGIFSDAGTNGFGWLINGSGIVDFKGDGKVGIGTASPSHQLQVQSTLDNIAAFTNGGYIGLQVTRNNTSYGAINVRDAGGRSIKVGSSHGAFGNSDAYLSDLANGLGAGVTLSTRTDADNNYMSLRARGDIAFYTNTGTTSLSERMRISASGDVGIGTTSPTQKLDIRYPAAGGMALLKSTDTTDGLLFGDMAYSASNDYQGMKHAAMGGVADYMIMSNGDDTYLSSRSGYSVFIRPGGNGTSSEIKVHPTEVVINDNSTTSDFRVESNNNANMLFVDGVSDKVGIGTGSPAYTLDVYSNVNAAGAIRSNNAYTGTGATASFWAQANNAQGYFHVNSSARTSTLYGVTMADYVEVRGGTNSAGLMLGNGALNTPIIFGNNDTERMRIAASGNVGIGTSSPSTPLHVYVGSSNPGVTIESDSTAGSWIRTKSNQSGAQLHKFGTNANGWHLYNDSISAFRLTVLNNGNFGVGTASPSTQLDVVGSGNFSGDVTITGHLSAATKSFLIDHPTEEGKKLQYGSLESPYHGVRLTGRNAVQNGACVVKLPEYISELVHNNNDINIQITNIKHGKILYVDDINMDNNEFTVKTDAWLGTSGLEFFWTFTAVRKDVKELQVEF